MTADSRDPQVSFELWARAAIGVGLSAAGWILYLGSRLPGRGPIAAYVFGPAVLTLFAMGVLVWGAVVSLRHRERPQRPRMIAFGLCAAVIGGANLPFPFPTRHDGHPSAVEFRLPIPPGEEWVVAWGGVGPEENLYAKAAADRRYALSLCKLGPDGRTFSGDGSELGQVHAFDAPVLAPAAGRVVRVVDGRADRLLGSLGARSSDELGGEAFGNHVVVAVAAGEYLFATYLRAGSVAVAVGDSVAVGDELGRVGNSGRDPFLDEPHVAIHLQDTPDPFWGQPLPWSFGAYEANGRAVDRGLPRGGIDASGTFVGERLRQCER